MISSQHHEVPALSLRERKKRLAQATIEETALRLFQQRGYEQTSIQDIADEVMMSSRTFFRYFASKEEVLFGPIRTTFSDAIRALQQVASTESPRAALKKAFEYLASHYEQQRPVFLTRYRVAAQTPSIACAYLYAFLEIEPAICEALCSRLEAATDFNEIRFLVALYMTAFRVTVQEWLEHEEPEDLVTLLHRYLDYLSSLPPKA